MYYPKQGAIIIGNIADVENIRRRRKSKAQGACFLENFILRRKSPSYSIKLSTGFRGGYYKLMIRDKWSMSAANDYYSPKLTNEIVVEVQADPDTSRMLKDIYHVPEDGIVASSYPNGKIVIQNIFFSLLNYRTRYWIKDYLEQHYTCTMTEDVVGVYVSKEYGQNALSERRTPVRDPNVPFNQHMNQWAV